MKKFFLFVAAASLALTSCSSDDSGSGSGDVVKFTVDGSTKTYRNVVVTPEGGAGLTITASNSATDMVVLEVEAEATGSGTVAYMAYVTGGNTYTAFEGDELAGSTEINNDERLKGTFAGTLTNNSNESTKVITNGSFDIKF